jgi:ketosteroid isomerase-like protein
MTEPALMALVDKQAIRELIMRYARGIDRRDYDLVRSCYHDDAHDDHGSYEGGPDGFIEHLIRNNHLFDLTMHFIGNQLIELDGDTAHCESYCVVWHRMPVVDDGPLRDMTLGLRYVDRLDRRDGRWGLAHRVCAMEWSRIDEVGEQWTFAAATVFGRHFPDDVVYD